MFRALAYALCDTSKAANRQLPRNHYFLPFATLPRRLPASLRVIPVRLLLAVALTETVPVSGPVERVLRPIVMAAILPKESVRCAR